MKDLKEGFTTGTCAAAAAKAAAVCYFQKKQLSVVDVKLPQGSILQIPVKKTEIINSGVMVTITKDAGDDPDITHGKDILVFLQVLHHKHHAEPLILKGGEGVGTVTKPGLPVDVGQPAINPNPRKMITENLRMFFSDDYQLVVEIIVPEGKELAKKTLNPHLGIIDGISILGTTGIVKPMSEEAFKVSLVPQLKTAKALGYNTIVLTPGNIGMESAVAHGVPEDAVVITSNFIGYMLENALDIGFTKIILWGHIGKLVKVAGGIFNTHNRMADARMEIITSVLALHGAPKELLEKVMDQITTEAVQQIIEENDYHHIWMDIADKATTRAERYLFSEAEVGIVLLKNRKDIICINKRAKEIGEYAQWNFLQ